MDDIRLTLRMPQELRDRLEKHLEAMRGFGVKYSLNDCIVEALSRGVPPYANPEPVSLNPGEFYHALPSAHLPERKSPEEELAEVMASVGAKFSADSFPVASGSNWLVRLRKLEGREDAEVEFLEMCPAIRRDKRLKEFMTWKIEKRAAYLEEKYPMREE